MLSSKIDRALFYSSPSWDSPIVKITKTPLHVLSSLSVMTKAEQAKPQVTNQDTSTNPEGTNPSGTCKDQGPGTIQPRPRGLCQQRKFFFKIWRRCKSGPPLLPSFPPFKFSFQFFNLFKYCVGCLFLLLFHWWLSDQRARYETVCMEMTIKICQFRSAKVRILHL